MEPESTFDTIKRLGLDSISVGNIIYIVPKGTEKKPYYAELLEIQYMENCTWLELTCGTYLARTDEKVSGTFGTNTLYIEKIEKPSNREILDKLNATR